ncbi:MAG: ABC transporter permease [Chloroflexi bacterium]|nr:ABC transporter permease [Chloroflexota bacterium]
MTKYLIQRFFTMIPTVFLVTVAIFAIVALLPGDPVTLMLGEQWDPKLEAMLRHDLKLDLPIHLRYLDWVGRAIRGDLGHSVRVGIPVADEIVRRLPITLQLAFIAYIFAFVIAIPGGIISAVRKYSASDVFATLFSIAGVALPNFWLAILLIFVFAYLLRWLPAAGFVTLWDDPLKSLQMSLMPAFSMGIHSAATLMRQTRSSMLDVMSQDYIRTAWSKGLTERTVIVSHALKNALLPVVTIACLHLGRMMGGAVITETIFAIPGVGRLGVESIFARDFTVVQGVVFVMALAVLFSNLLADVLYSYLDPRIKYG